MKSFGKGNKFSKRGSERSEGRSEGTRTSGRKSGGDRFGSRSPSRSSSRSSPMETFEATCDKCGKNCDLPFKPTGNKPVYCRECFRDSAPESSGRSNNFDRNSSRDRAPSRDRFEAPSRPSPSAEDLDAINRKLDKIMRALKID